MPLIYSYRKGDRCAVKGDKLWQSMANRAALQTECEYLMQQPRDRWREPRARKLRPDSDKFREYFEIRFFSDRTQQRPIGYFFTTNDEFTILLWATEKGGKFVPPTWAKTCKDRRDDLSAGATTFRHLLEFDEDEEE